MTVCVEVTADRRFGTNSYLVVDDYTHDAVVIDSNLEPELKVNLQYPPSAAILEGNWRALARTGAPRPLFLDILHRNLIAVGYWNSETSASPGAETQGSDVLALLRAELQRENRRVFIRDIVLNTFFFLLGVVVAVATHYLW